MANYRLSNVAKSDLQRIYRHGVREFGKLQADRYYDALLTQFEKLAEQPYRYQAVDDIRVGYRRSVLGKESIYYRVDGDIVEIMAILGQQHAEEWFEPDR